MTEPTDGKVIPTFVEMLRFQAWMGMGKIVNPQTQEVDRNLESARVAIDLLAELETKTEGNRSQAETRLLQGTLTELRLNYLDEQKKKPAPAGGKSEEPAETQAADKESDPQ